MPISKLVGVAVCFDFLVQLLHELIVALCWLHVGLLFGACVPYDWLGCRVGCHDELVRHCLEIPLLFAGVPCTQQNLLPVPLEMHLPAHRLQVVKLNPIDKTGVSCCLVELLILPINGLRLKCCFLDDLAQSPLVGLVRMFVQGEAVKPIGEFQISTAAVGLVTTTLSCLVTWIK